MRNAIIIFCLLFFPVSLFAQSFNEIEMNKKKMDENNVKVQTKWKVSEDTEKGQKIVQRRFDKEGNMIEEINFKSNGEMSTRLTYKYNESGQKTEYINYDVQKEEISYKQKIHYDELGRKIRELGFDGITNFRVEYDYKGTTDKLEEIVKYDKSGMVEERWDYKYDGNDITIFVYQGKDNLEHKTYKEYDPYNNLIEKSKISPEGKIINTTTYTYDSKGKLVQESEYYSGELSHKLLYEYDSWGNVVRVIKEMPDGKKFIKHSFSYDKSDNLVKEKWYDGIPDDYSKKSYDYDQEENLTKVDSYYSAYQYKSLYKYTYEYY